MPPKQQFQKLDIVNAGLELIREKGLGGLSARKIAEHLNCSIAPVYSVFATMDDLKVETMKELKAILLRYTVATYTENPFFNMGVGIVLFAKEEPMLYRALFLDYGRPLDIIDDVMASLESLAKGIAIFKKITATQTHQVLLEMFIFTHGLATLVSAGYQGFKTTDEIRELLWDAGETMIDRAISKNKK